MHRAAVDVAIAGGGPVGCAAAIRLARTGASVLVLERGDYVRRLPGERLLPEVLAALASLDVRVATQEAPGTVSLWGGPKPVVTPGFLHPLGGGHAVVRPALDRACAGAATRAGVAVRTGARIRSLAPRGSGWHIAAQTPRGPLDVNAGYLVDATGRAAAIARHLGATVQRAGDLFTALAWVPALGELGEMFRMLHVEAIVGGWVYAITVGEDTVALGACARRAEHRQVRGGLLRSAIPRSDLLRAFATSPLPAPRVFPSSPALTWPPSGAGWVAIGDAAAQLDPISGSGLRQGLETAFRATELAMLPQSDRDAISPYYDDALRWMHEEHRRIRVEVYTEAADQLGASFLSALDRYVSPEEAASR